jgi:hypothetical protein
MTPPRTRILPARERKARRAVIEAVALVDIARRSVYGIPEALLVNAEIALARLEHLLEQRTGITLAEEPWREGVALPAVEPPRIAQRAAALERRA